MNKCIDCGREFNPSSPGASSCRGPFCNKKFNASSVVIVPESVTQISAKISKGKFPVYLVGGCVRDSILGRKIKDFDLATSATPDELLEIFPESITVGKSFGVLKIPVKTDKETEIIEVATFRKDGEYTDARRPNSVEFSSPEEDAKRRDFTINALFFDLENNKVVDYVDGLKDLKNKEIKAVGNPEERFNEDALRILRALRFAVVLDFKIEKKTLDSAIKNSPLLKKVSGERIKAEVSRIFSTNPVKGSAMINSTGILKSVLPNLEKLDIKENGHPEIVYWKALQEDSKVSIEEISNQLKLENKEVRLMDFIDRSKDVFQESNKNKFFVEKDFPLVISYFKVRGEKKIEKIEKDYQEYLKNPVDLSLIPSGDQLISLGIKPGPNFGKIQKEVREKILNREIYSSEQMISYLNSIKKSYL